MKNVDSFGCVVRGDSVWKLLLLLLLLVFLFLRNDFSMKTNKFYWIIVGDEIIRAQCVCVCVPGGDSFIYAYNCIQISVGAATVFLGSSHFTYCGEKKNREEKRIYVNFSIELHLSDDVDDSTVEWPYWISFALHWIDSCENIVGLDYYSFLSHYMSLLPVSSFDSVDNNNISLSLVSNGVWACHWRQLKAIIIILIDSVRIWDGWEYS